MTSSSNPAVSPKGIPGLQRVDHVGITVPNLAEATKFFIDVLGCEYMYTLGPFQNDENCRVFLISLKAGGVGLNLTAADYVYIVDPWWNPAVEQQAIDRTHRIGQTKNIFAYRMICTDTVEDKILKLQERKRNLAKDLITDDEGFVKSLTKEDVEYLFS